MNIHYSNNHPITEAAFIDLLQRSTLAARRPVESPECIKAMLQHANLLCTAWDDDVLIGVARSVSDFEYCCYLSDLAVDLKYQHQGVGRELIRLTQARLGKHAKIVLLAAPLARDYYPKLLFDAHDSAWVIPATRELT